LCDKLSQKDASLDFIARCLEIIETQKLDWFTILLDF